MELWLGKEKTALVHAKMDSQGRIVRLNRSVQLEHLENLA